MSADFSQLKKIIGYKPDSRLGRFVYRLVVLMILLLVLGETFKGFHALGLVLDAFLAFILLIVLLFMALRAVNQKLLWKVRNRLILTYLLMGLAPVVLFGTITGIAAYVFAGQYATNAAITVLDDTERRVQDDANTVAMYLSSHPNPGQAKITNGSDYGPGQSRISLAYLDGGVWRALPPNLIGGRASVSPFADHATPSWLQQKFDGTMSLDGKLYLCSLAFVTSGQKTTTVLGSVPVDRDTLDSISHGLGRMMLLPGFRRNGSDPGDLPPEPKESADQPIGEIAPILRPEGVRPPRQHNAMVRGTQDKDKSEVTLAPSETKTPNAGPGESGDQTKLKVVIPSNAVRSTDFREVNGGSLPPAEHLFDWRLSFGAPIPIVSWSNGDLIPAILGVVSRPTLLYTRLFATSVDTGSFIRAGLIVISIFFGLLEMFSLFMAVQLSRTITESVYGLYQGTAEIDRGNLSHRIEVKQKDQLGALSHSFNTMAASIQDLLVQQREKDRMLNELMIAQEVQKNLFPASPIRAGNLEVHALCMPARTVSGDYYDYIIWDEHRLCLALGDISGKGISAALLMASLNSAVRAFTLGSEDGHTKAPSPAGLLTCLNRHLYRSTTPEKYATLFIAVFDSVANTLTYSNGGHLPPLVLSKDGTVQRLECGGAVVGLLDNLQYQEATISLRTGDLLVMYSDGLTEPERDDDEFGEDRLRDFVHANRTKDLDVLASESIGTVKQWIGNAEQPDDMTILLARYT